MHRNEYTGVSYSSTHFMLVMLITVGVITTMACGGGEEMAPEAETMVEEPVAEESPMDTSPRVSFLARKKVPRLAAPCTLCLGLKTS